MSTELESNLGFAPRPSLSWLQIWRTAALQPTVAAYQELVQREKASPGKAWGWLFGSSLISGLLVSLAPFLSEPAPIRLALAILVFALAAVIIWAFFAGCTHLIAHLFRGKGDYTTLIYLFAAFSTPLVLIAGLLSLIPHTGPLLVCLYLYWSVLYVVATRTVYQFSSVKAFIAVLVAFCLSGGLLLGAGFGVLAWGS